MRDFYSLHSDPQGIQYSQSQMPATSGWKLYLRLVRYAMKYKSRLLIAVILSLIIAFSFGTMIVSLGSVLKLTLYEPPVNTTSMGLVSATDPALSYAERIRHWDERYHSFWNQPPTGWDNTFLQFVQQMREHKLFALSLAIGIVLMLSIISGCSRFFQEYLAGSVGAYVTIDLSRQMYQNIMDQSLGFFEKHSSGEVVARFSNDIFMVNRGLSNVFVKLLREPFKAVTFLLIALRVDVWLTLLGVCVLPPLGYALVQLGFYVRNSVRRSLMKVADLASLINETTRGIVIIKTFQLEQYLRFRFTVESEKLRKFMRRMVRADSATEPITEFILVVGFSVFVLFSGYRVVKHQLDLGDLLQVYLALAMILDPVRKLSTVNNLVQTSIASAGRVFEFIDARPEIHDNDDAIAIPRLQKGIRFENVSFSYDGVNNVLNRLNCTIRAGEKVAIVGHSGAGKTTLIKLIPRLYDVTEGAIYFDDVDIRKATLDSLRSQIAVVTQDTILFSGTVRDNVTGGREGIADEDVWHALRLAHAEGFVRRLPSGLDTPLGEFGQLLSGGERQRLALARAILKDPSILLLDEATSNLDSESERYIQEALEQFLPGRTSIIIAHRLSTVLNADRIIVLDRGTIVEEGTHEALMEKQGYYYNLYKYQFGGNGDEK